MTKIAMITGATSGFGEACAREFAKNKYDVIITGRRSERLEQLKRDLVETYGGRALALCFDVRNRSEVQEKVGGLDDSWRPFHVLVNNAGLAAGLDKIQDGNYEDWDRMLDTNVKGLLYVTEASLTYLKNVEGAHIINIGSTAGKEVYEKGNVYCASKHAVDALTKGMRIDLLEHGIKVTQIAPGAAETEFSLVRFHGDEKKAKSVYNGYQPMTAEDISSLVYYVTTLPPHLCVNDLVVTSLAQANSVNIKRE